MKNCELNIFAIEKKIVLIHFLQFVMSESANVKMFSKFFKHIVLSLYIFVFFVAFL